MNKIIYPWEQTYEKKLEVDILAIIRSIIPSVEIYPLITTIHPQPYIGFEPTSRKDAGDRPLPVLEVDTKTECSNFYTHYLISELNWKFNKNSLPFSYTADTRYIRIMTSNVYYRFGETPSDEEKKPFRRALNNLRITVDLLIAEILKVNVPNLKEAFIQKLSQEGKINTQKDRYQAENAIDMALVDESREHRIMKRSRKIEQIIKELENWYFNSTF